MKKNTLQRILSATSTALGHILDIIRKYPKIAIGLMATLAVGGFIYWRLQQPFNPEQSLLFRLGIFALFIGGVSLWLEKSDSQGTRPKAVLMSIVAITIGLFLGYLGIRPI